MEIDSVGMGTFALNQALKMEQGSQLVTRTLDTLNGPVFQGVNDQADYNFQKDVLMGGFAAKGATLNIKV